MDRSVSTTHFPPPQGRRHQGYIDVGGYRDVGGGGRWVCDRCGVNVSRTDLHNAFHDRVDRPEQGVD